MIDKKQQIIKAFHATLVDFGYSSLTLEQVEESTKKALSDDPQPGIIAMFIRDWLEDEFADLKPEVQRLFG